MSMQLTINGETKQIDAGTVRELLVSLALDKQAVAVEVNREVVPKKLHETTPLKEGDTIELVTLVGGG